MESRGGSRIERWRADAVVGFLLTIALLLAANAALARGLVTDAHAALLLGYLAAWVPLLGAVIVACYLHGSRSLPRDIGLRFRPIDLLWGLSIGLLARVVTSLIEIAGYGRTGGSAVILGNPAHDGWWWFGMIVAPVVVAPIIEELFFRGLVLRALLGALRGPGSTAVAIVLSSAVFALLHVLDAGSTTAAIVTGTSTLVFGLAAATLATLTGRLGGAIIAHIAFNALAVATGLL